MYLSKYEYLCILSATVFVFFIGFFFDISLLQTQLSNTRQSIHKLQETIQQAEHHVNEIPSLKQQIDALKKSSQTETQTNASQATPQYISLDLQNANLVDALHRLAEMLHLNMLISPNVNGVVTLHLQHFFAEKALDLVLKSYGLTKYKVSNAWLIALRTDIVKDQQDELQLQKIEEETAPLVTRVWQIHYAKADDIAHLLQDNTNSMLSKRGHVKVDTRTNIICIQDIEAHFQELNGLIRRLDIPVQQVLVEARLASVDSDYERELGVHFAVKDPTDMLKEVADAPARFSLAVARLGDGSVLDIQLAALENEGHGEFISSPHLFTANQQAASIESGEEIPYQEISRSGATGVAFKKAVLSLKVIPQVMPGNRVLLQLQVNQDKPSNRVVQGVPAITTRQMSTNVLVKNGETIVLGGIYETDKEHNQQRIPFLGKIPLVGFLFQQQNAAEKKRELLIFVTPNIIPQAQGENGESK